MPQTSGSAGFHERLVRTGAAARVHSGAATPDLDLAAAWAALLQRIGAVDGTLARCTLPQTFFLAGSVAYLQARDLGPAAVDRARERLWVRAARVILRAGEGVRTSPATALFRLRDALDRAPMDAAVCAM